MSLAPIANSLRRARGRVLVYHSVSPRPLDRWSITPELLDGHLRWLQEHHYAVRPLADLVQAALVGAQPRAVALTFDDAYLDFAECALPILQRYRVPATLFVPFAALGQTSYWSTYAPDYPLLDQRQLEAVQRAGVTIGSHTMRHLNLTRLSQAELDEELGASHQLVVERYREPFVSLAYPSGFFTAREMRAARLAGYHCAFGVGGKFGIGPESDPFNLPRDSIRTTTTVGHLASILSGWTDAGRAVRKPFSIFVTRASLALHNLVK